jgi:geranylgeranyl pyrophosphate synthase
LIWRDALDKALKPLDALKIYALKTAPAFEAALYSGIRLAGDASPYVEAIRTFSRNLGVGFQILNDLQDWNGDTANKVAAAGDVLGGRPTLLLALALESLPAESQAELLDIVSGRSDIEASRRIATVRRLYQQANVFETARKLIDKHQERAEAIADQINPEPLRRLFYFLIDTVLHRVEEGEAASPSPQFVAFGLPIARVTEPTD